MNNNTSKEIIDKIKKEEIKMRPKSYFVFKVFSLIALAVVVFIIALYLSSFILFSFRPFPLFPSVRRGRIPPGAVGPHPHTLLS